MLETVDLIKELSSICERTKKVPVKKVIIQLLERIVQAQHTQNEKNPQDTLVWTEIAILYKKAKKWAAYEELKDVTLHLMTIILAHSKIDFFGQNVNSFLNTELCSKAKVRSYAYPCLLQFLRGRYYQDTLENYEDAIRGVYATGRHFSVLSRDPAEQSFSTVSTRLNLIADLVFFRRKGPIPEEFLDISASIAVQIAAHRYNQSKKHYHGNQANQ